METVCVAGVRLQGRRFLNFLRGMETQLTRMLGGAFGIFLNFLRGMETADRSSNAATCLLLPKLP